MTQTIVVQKQSKLYLIYFKNSFHTVYHKVNCSKNMHAPVYIDFWLGH